MTDRATRCRDGQGGREEWLGRQPPWLWCPSKARPDASKANPLAIPPRSFYEPGRYSDKFHRENDTTVGLLSNIFGRSGHSHFSYFLALRLFLTKSVFSCVLWLFSSSVGKWVVEGPKSISHFSNEVVSFIHLSNTYYAFIQHQDTKIGKIKSLSAKK